MEPNIQTQLDEQKAKLDQIHESVRKMEKYMKLTFWITLAVIVLPLIIMMFTLPSLINSYTSTLSGLEGVL